MFLDEIGDKFNVSTKPLNFSTLYGRCRSSADGTDSNDGTDGTVSEGKKKKK